MNRSHKTLLISSIIVIPMIAAGCWLYASTRTNDAGGMANIRATRVHLDSQCSYLSKVENLHDLMIQLMASADTECLQKYSTEDLEAIWRIKIYEVKDINAPRTREYEAALIKPYLEPNDAYLITRTHREKFDDLYIVAAKDFLQKSKGLNQWIPEKYNDKPWWFSLGEPMLAEEPYVELQTLPGFIEPARMYAYPSARGDSSVEISFDVSKTNNYVNRIDVLINNNLK